MLDINYNNKRFENFDNFKDYIRENIEEIQKSSLAKYKIQNFDDYKEYLCIDNYGNYYIFKEDSAMDYTVLLDQYTIDDEIFINQYVQKSNATKAQMNLNKFNQMLNRGDYSAAYEKLNDEFRKKYFEDEKSFKEYVLKNLFRYNQFDYKEISGQDKEYKIKTEIKNMLKLDDEGIFKRFKINLSNNNFDISFDI